MLPDEYVSVQSQIRLENKNYAKMCPNWVRSPQNNKEKLNIAYFKPRVNILIRPPFVKTGLERCLSAGRGEVIFHMPGDIQQGVFIPHSNSRIIVGELAPQGLLYFLDSKLEMYSPQISSAFARKAYRDVIQSFYFVVRESIISQRAFSDF